MSLDSLGFRLTEEDPWNNAFWLGVFIAVAMLVLVPITTGRSFPAAARSEGRIVLLSGALQAASTGFFVLAIDATAVSNAVAIVAATPMLAAVVAHYVIKEKTSTRTWLAIFAALAGVLVVVSGSLGGAGSIGDIYGDIYAVLTITAFSFNLTLWRRFPELNRQVVIGFGGLLLPWSPLSQRTHWTYLPTRSSSSPSSAFSPVRLVGCLLRPRPASYPRQKWVSSRRWRPSQPLPGLGCSSLRSIANNNHRRSDRDRRGDTRCCGDKRAKARSRHPYLISGVHFHAFH